MLAQLTRHRIATYCVESQRYVKYDKDEYVSGVDYVIPPAIESDTKEVFIDNGYDGGNMKRLKDVYIDFHNTVAECYNNLILNGIKPEDARMILPQSFFTNLTMTMNYRELRHFIKLRADKHAQWEIRELAMRVVSLLPKWLVEDLFTPEDYEHLISTFEK